jgi:hypothetical protein
MTVLKLIFALVCVVGPTQLAWSQNEKGIFSGSHSAGIPGFLDPQTSTFTTRVESESAPATATGTYYYGTIQIVLTLYIASFFESGTVFQCSGTAGTSDSGIGGSGEGFSNSYTTSAPLPTNKVTTCTINIDYFWQLVNPSTDVINVSVNATSPPGFAPLATANRDGITITGVPTTNGTITTLYVSLRF